MTEPDARTDEGWTDPGAMDPSIWNRKPRSASYRRTVWIVLAGLFALPFLAVWSNLWGLSDVGPPKGLAEWRAVSVPNDKNAAIMYRAVADAVRPGRFPAAPPSEWATASAEEKLWLNENARPLAIWRAATDFPDCDSTGGRPESKPLSETEVRILCRLARLEGLRRENQLGEEETLDWYLALLRFSNHLRSRRAVEDRPPSSIASRLASSRLMPWADHPNRSVDSLRRALSETRRANETAPPPLDSILFEADRVERALADADALDRLLTPGEPDGWSRTISRFSRALNSEPERSRRVARRIFADWVDAFRTGKVPTEDENLDFGPLVLFKSSPFGEGPPEVNPTARRFKNSVYLKAFLPDLRGFVKTARTDERERRDLVLHIAEQLARRLNREPPKNLDDLDRLDLPGLP